MQNKKILFALLLLAIICISYNAAAQFGLPEEKQNETPEPEISFKGPEKEIPAGLAAELEITIKLAEGTHIEKADSDAQPIIDITFDLPKGFEIDPAQIRDWDEIPDGKSKTYKLLLFVDKDTKPDKYEIIAHSDIKYCDSTLLLCYPFNYNNKISVTVGEYAGNETKPHHADNTTTSKNKHTHVQTQPESNPNASASNYISFFINTILFITIFSFVLLFFKGKNIFGVIGLLGLSAALVLAGINAGQHEKARQIAATLCTSCIGLEPEYKKEDFSAITEEQRQFLQKLDNEIVIVIFSAVWCKSCPKAKEDLHNLTAINPEKLKLIIIDIEQHKAELPDLQEWQIVSREKRPPLPSTIIRGDNKPFFGAHDIAKRIAERIMELENNKK